MVEQMGKIASGTMADDFLINIILLNVTRYVLL